MQRRDFLKYSTLAGSTFILPNGFSFDNLVSEEKNLYKLCILHTNDVHSRMEPFPMDGGKNQGQGGIAKRAAIINKIRSEEKNVLLLDAGDMFQGTPYFNIFKGELEIKLMSQLGYDVGTIGNHDFDAGIENLSNQIKNHANFSLVNSNYNFKNSEISNQILPFKIIKKGKLRIGITGVGVELNGLVPKSLYQDTEYSDPITKANYYASILKNDYKCDFVICLSHLGYSHKGNQVSDLILAKESIDIDLIIGGHTHTFLDKPTVIVNKKAEEVFVTQAGWAGIILGRLDLFFEVGTSKKCISCNNILIEK